jgi:hypothetical protein
VTPQDTARAVLTLGPGTCKDKLLQAAGRMRLLKKGHQTLLLVGTEEVTQHIRGVCGLSNGDAITAQHVLTWTLANTIVSTAPEGLAEWSFQGLDFCATRGNPTAAPQPEVLQLRKLYGKAFTAQPLVGIFSHRYYNWHTSLEGGLASTDTLELLKGVVERVQKHGNGKHNNLISTGQDEECEREVEREVNVGRKPQPQRSHQLPREERDWAYNKVFQGDKTFQDIKDASLASSLRQVFKDRLGDGDTFRRINLAGKQIYVTQNFLETIETIDSGHGAPISDFLRPVGPLLIFRRPPDVEAIFLLSGREYDGILAARPAESGDSVQLTMLAYARLASTDRGKAAARGLPDGLRLKMDHLVALQLFAGETVFATEDQKTALREMLPNRTAGAAALKLPAMRGLKSKIARSDLDIIYQTLD